MAAASKDWKATKIITEDEAITNKSKKKSLKLLIHICIILFRCPRLLLPHDLQGGAAFIFKLLGNGRFCLSATVGVVEARELLAVFSCVEKLFCNDFAGL